MKNVKIFESQVGFGVLINPPEGLAEFEQYLQDMSEEELLDVVKFHLRSAGSLHPNSPLRSISGGREGIIDLLVGMFTVGLVRHHPSIGGGQNNSQ